MSELIKPTDAMVNEATKAISINATYTSLRFQDEAVKRTYRKWANLALRVGLNHPDARGLFADEDDRREPLSDPNMEIIEDARPGDVRAGDHLTRTRVWETCGVVVTDSREGIAHHRDEDGDWYTKDGMWITNGEDEYTTLTIRRPVQELPEEDAAVIVPADGLEFIETRTGKKSRRLTWDAECLVWYDARGTHLHGDITPGTWKVEGE